MGIKVKDGLDTASKEELLKDWTEKKELPMGRKAFHEWSERIIQAAAIPCEPDKREEFLQSQKFALADMILHCGPTEDFKEDAHFIKYLRKVAVNQVANALREEIRDAFKAKKELAEKEAGIVKSETPPTLPNETPKILGN
jgi:hypothetical protein